MAPFPKGATVRQIMQAPVVGTIASYALCQETGEIQYLVTWPDADGDGHEESHYFRASEIELVE